LVGDADPGDVDGRQPRLGEGGPARRDDGGPDLLGIVLDPAGIGETLRQLELRPGTWRALRAEDHRPRAGRPLVDGEDVAGFAHFAR
jgi:hypothetical protein